ncbi:hypothetical protein HanIR_Chr03g0136841 [Helianthus annuus]|nr:hypothetical protein HanIR_Chr03g0136841 [Helianthus annuus]
MTQGCEIHKILFYPIWISPFLASFLSQSPSFFIKTQTLLNHYINKSPIPSFHFSHTTITPKHSWITEIVR